MANHVWSVLCESSSVDSQTNVVSLFKCVERIELEQLGSEEPAEAEFTSLPVNMELVSLWQRSDIDAPEPDLPIRIRLRTPGDFRAPSYEVTIKFKGHVRARHILRMASLPFDGPGLYVLQVQQQNTSNNRWKTVANAPLEVVVKPKGTQEMKH